MDLEDRLRAALSTTPTPAASLAVWHDGQLASASAGSADSGVPAAPDTLYWLASTSKVIGATATLRRLGTEVLDRPVVQTTPTLGLAGPASATELTLRHLLSHTSGLDPDFFPDTGQADDALSAYLARCAELEQVLPLASTPSYCTTGLILAGRMLELSCGTDWDSALRDQVLGPLHMHDTITIRDTPAPGRMAVGHTIASGRAQPLPSLRIPRAGGPAGGLRSTARDVVRFAAMHLTDGRGPDGAEVLPGETVREMQRPQAVVPGRATAFVPAAWGLGWALYSSDRGLIPGHDGGLPGFSSFVRLVPAQRLAVALVVNSDQAAPLFRDLVQPLLQELGDVRLPGPLPEPAAVGSFEPDPQWLGTFSRGRLRADVSAGAGRLHVHWQEPPFLEGGEWTARHDELVPDDLSAGRFLCAGTRDNGWEPITFFRLPDGRSALQAGAGALVRTT